MGHRVDPRSLEGARCAETDPEIFYPAKGGTTRPAKRVCGSCEIQPDCLDYALQTREQYGIWGGASESERRQMLRGRRSA
jgi:WhiB family redox-sensing transcriptional regulator